MPIMMRNFYSSCSARAIRPAFKPHDTRRGTQSFEKGFEAGSPEKGIKIWDKKGISKHEFFIRKYGNISTEERQKLDDKVKRQKFLREQRKLHEQSTIPQPLKREKISLNPLYEYIFGSHAVIAALTAAKRETFSALYLYNSSKEHTPKILALAKRFGIRIVEKKSKGEMNTLSSNGVHNGVVLETRPLILPEIVSLGRNLDAGRYELSVIDDTSHRTKTEEKLVVRKFDSAVKVYPLGIFVDGITDPQNLGSIVRSAYFLGADFMVIPEFESARLGPVAAKAAAGALDLFTIYKAGKSLEFLDSAKENGWTIITTSSREGETDLRDMKLKHRQQVSSRYVGQSELPRIMSNAPVLMVLGSEGAGVRTNVKLRSDFLVGWSKGRPDDGMIDSLNVGVAAGMLISKCLE